MKVIKIICGNKCCVDYEYAGTSFILLYCPLEKLQAMTHK